MQAYTLSFFYNTGIDYMQIYILMYMLWVPANWNQHQCNLLFALFAHSLFGRISEPWANKTIFSAHDISCLNLSSCIFFSVSTCDTDSRIHTHTHTPTHTVLLCYFKEEYVSVIINRKNHLAKKIHWLLRLPALSLTYQTNDWLSGGKCRIGPQQMDFCARAVLIVWGNPHRVCGGPPCSAEPAQQLGHWGCQHPMHTRRSSLQGGLCIPQDKDRPGSFQTPQPSKA